MVVVPVRAADVLAARKLEAGQRSGVHHDVARRAHLLDVAAAHHGDAVAQAEGLVDVMAHVEDGALVAVENVEHVLLQARLEMRV